MDQLYGLIKCIFPALLFSPRLCDSVVIIVIFRLKEAPVSKSEVIAPDKLHFFDETKFASALEQMQSFTAESEPLHTTRELIQWLDDMKARNHIYQKRTALRKLADWKIDSRGCLAHKDGRFFRIVGIQVTSSSREVKAWSQPILDNVGTGIIGLLCMRLDNTTYFLMQAKAEAGNRNIIQIGPTVQFTQENYVDNDRLEKPFLYDEFNQPGPFITIRETRQSEEGARFYMEHHLHKILLLPDGIRPALPPEYRWFTYNQIRFFLHLGESVNSCARSILACLL